MYITQTMIRYTVQNTNNMYIELLYGVWMKPVFRKNVIYLTFNAITNSHLVLLSKVGGLFFDHADLFPSKVL